MPSELAFSLSSDDGYHVVEWAPLENSGYFLRSFPRRWFWRLSADAEELVSGDSYTGTASLGELRAGEYTLTVSPPDSESDDIWRSTSFDFAVLSSGQSVDASQVLVAALVEQVGALLQEKEELELRLESLFGDIESAHRTIASLEAQVTVLKGLGNIPSSGSTRTLWSRLGSSSVAAVIAICTFAGGVGASFHEADVQAQATNAAAHIEASTGGAQQSHLQGLLDKCIVTSNRLEVQLNAQQR
jgi:hypothetical protein